MIGLIADFFRFFWALFYWNIRKTIFRLLREKGAACPCQNPSDSGRALETGCDAALTWANPARFRKVCPLLKTNTSGRLVCAAASQEVRPFWGRAAIFYLGAFAVLYLVGAFSFFVTQSTLGKSLSLRQAIWPPAWKEYPQVQSRYFFEKARAAIANRAINEAVINLSLAYQLDPKNYAAGLTLAQLCQIGQPGLADQVYVQLVREHPTERASTLVAWYQSLLLRGDFNAIRALAAEALRSDDPARASSWLHALIFAQRCEPDITALEKLIADPTLPPQARDLLTLELSTQKLTNDEIRLILLRQRPAEASPYFDYYRVQRLISLGFGEEALAVMGDPAIQLGSSDRLAFWLDAHARMGWTEADRREVMAMLAGSSGGAAVIPLCAHLIRYSNHKLCGLLFDRLRQTPVPANEASYSTYIALLCTAGANEEYGALQETAATLRAIAGGGFRALDDVVAFFHAHDPNARIEAHLPALQPQPIEITYALLQRFHRPSPPPLKNERQP